MLGKISIKLTFSDIPMPARGTCSVFSVELKPKEGVLPIDPAAHPLRKKMSKYALKQLMKVREGTIAAVNDYDPMDLFSGDHNRMEKALRSLIINPQNNLRVFVNGVLEFGTNNPGFDSLKAVLKPFLNSKQNPEEVVENFIRIVTSALLAPLSSVQIPKNSEDCLDEFSVLGGLLKAQKSCSADVESLYPHYIRLCELFEEKPNLREEMGVDGPNYGDAPFWTGVTLEKFRFSPDEVDWMISLRNYLATSTLKDCSIFLTFQPLIRTDNEKVIGLPIVKLLDEREFIFHASLVDLDPKPFERIERHFFEAQKLIEIAKSAGL